MKTRVSLKYFVTGFSYDHGDITLNPQYFFFVFEQITHSYIELTKKLRK